MEKPKAYNYVKAEEEIARLREQIANLEIRCRIAESNKADGDLISRADAIEAVCGACCDDGKKYEKCTIYRRGLCADVEALEALPSADAEPTVIRAKTFMRKEDFDKFAEDIKRQGENVICIPCDAEVVSADAVPQLRQKDTLIIADALRYLAEDTERHELDRARAEKLREQILQYGASMCHSADASQNLAKPNKALKGSDLISRQDIEWTEMLVADGDGQYHSEDIAYRSQIDSLPSAEPVDCTDFIRWIRDEVMDEENWEMNAIAVGEVICRKLRKLGAVFSVGGYYHSADRPPYRIDPYGTAWVIAHDGQDLDKVGRVILDNFPYAKTFYPDRPKGEWIEREDWDGDNYYECSVCGESFVLIDGTPSMNLYHYCPNCGAKME